MDKGNSFPNKPAKRDPTVPVVMGRRYQRGKTTQDLQMIRAGRVLTQEEIDAYEASGQIEG